MCSTVQSTSTSRLCRLVRSAAAIISIRSTIGSSFHGGCPLDDSTGVHQPSAARVVVSSILVPPHSRLPDNRLDSLQVCCLCCCFSGVKHVSNDGKKEERSQLSLYFSSSRFPRPFFAVSLERLCPPCPPTPPPSCRVLAAPIDGDGAICRAEARARGADRHNAAHNRLACVRVRH